MPNAFPCGSTIPGCEREPEVCDPVLGLQAGKVVILHFDTSSSKLGDLRREVGYEPGRLGLFVCGTDGALGHVECRRSAAERDRVVGFAQNLEAELLVVEASRLTEIAREKHWVSGVVAEHLSLSSTY